MIQSHKTTIVVVSHHQSGGGKPLDSLWFSKEECSKRNIELTYLWTRKKSDFLRLILLSLRAEFVIFDGIYSLHWRYGNFFFNYASKFYKKIAIYWHETEHQAEKLASEPVFNKAISSPHILHFHVCSYGLNMLHNKYHISPSKTYLLTNISNHTNLLSYKLPLRQEPFLFVACGNVSERKGTDLFLEIAQRLVKKENSAHFTWIGKFGGGEYSEAVIYQEIEKRNLLNNVTFTGNLENPFSIVAKSHAFLLTSRDDPMPKVLMEALALGKPCVAFDVGGVAELLAGFGTVVSLEELDEFVETLISIPYNLDFSAQAARREFYMDRYSPAAFAARFAAAVEWWKSI